MTQLILSGDLLLMMDNTRRRSLNNMGDDTATTVALQDIPPSTATDVRSPAETSSIASTTGATMLPRTTIQAPSRDNESQQQQNQTETLRLVENCTTTPESKTLKKVISRYTPGWNALFTLAGLVVAITGIVYGCDAYRYQRWTSIKDHLEYCKDNMVSFQPFLTAWVALIVHSHAISHKLWF